MQHVLADLYKNIQLQHLSFCNLTLWMPWASAPFAPPLCTPLVWDECE